MASSNDVAAQKRIELQYCDGVNTLTAWNVAKRQEFSHVENATSPLVGIIERRDGYLLLGNALGATFNYGTFRFDSQNASSRGIWRCSTVAGITNFYWLGMDDVWHSLNDPLPYTSQNPISVAIAENRCYVVNGDGIGCYINEDGLTITHGSTEPQVTNDFYGAPIARKINAFGGKLWLGDVTYNGVRYQNQVHMSSPIGGLVSQSAGLFAAGSTEITVTDTSYIYNSDSLEVFRGDLHVTDLTVTGKTETTLTVTATAAEVQASDQIWVKGTNPLTGGGVRRFRWQVSPTGGVPNKKFDTFTLVGGQSGPINMMVNAGTYQMISNADVIAYTDGTTISLMDSGIGCVSPRGFIKYSGLLYYVHWTGIYTSSGGLPKYISAPVNEYFSGATKAGLANARCAKKGFSVFFHIGDVSMKNPDGSPFRQLSNCVIEYNLHQDNWFAHTGIPADCFEHFVDTSDVDRAVFSSNVGGRAEVFAFLEGAKDDDGSAYEREIPFRADTATWLLASSEECVAEPKRVVLHMDRGNSVDCFVSLDDGDFYEISGQFDKGVGVVPVTSKDKSVTSPPVCNRVKLSFRTSAGAKPRLAKASLVYSETQSQIANRR